MSYNGTRSTVIQGGISTTGLLGVALIILKLTHTIDWSWVWVLLPFWGGAGLVLAALLIMVVGYILFWGIERL